MDLIRQSRISP